MSIYTERLRSWWQRGQATPAEQATSVTAGGNLDLEPVVICQAANLLEAQVIQGRLASENIPAMVRGEALGSIYGFTTGALAAVDVLVPAPLAEKAMALLADEHELAEDDLEDESLESSL